VGGGPTGVEFAAELRDFLNAYLPSVSPGIHSLARISLLEASPEILSVFDASLSHYALGKLNDQGVDVYRNAIVKKVDQGEVVLQDGAPFLGQTIVWSTGIKPTDLIQNLKVPKTKSGRVLVDAFFRIPSLPDIYALGDCADVEDKNFPATAQVAMQEAKSLARQFNDRAKQREAKPFSYKHMGMLAYIGDHDALVDLPFVKGKGVFAWLFWRSAYLTKLVSLRHKMMVLWDWCKSFLFGPDVSRF
jgi:NADH:ubiquinone reductase (non-electrogenic)